MFRTENFPVQGQVFPQVGLISGAAYPGNAMCVLFVCHSCARGKSSCTSSSDAKNWCPLFAFLPLTFAGNSMYVAKNDLE